MLIQNLRKNRTSKLNRSIMAERSEPFEKEFNPKTIINRFMRESFLIS